MIEYLLDESYKENISLRFSEDGLYLYKYALDITKDRLNKLKEEDNLGDNKLISLLSNINLTDKDINYKLHKNFSFYVEDMQEVFLKLCETYSKLVEIYLDNDYYLQEDLRKYEFNDILTSLDMKDITKIKESIIKNQDKLSDALESKYIFNHLSTDKECLNTMVYLAEMS